MVELESVEPMPPVAFKETETHLSPMEPEAGLRINFGEQVLKDGLHRIVNKHQGPRPNDFNP